MKFYDRKEELSLLEDILVRSKKQSQFTLLSGRRRVGKTSLLLKAFENKPHLYLFVSRKSEVLLCAEFQRAAEESLGVQILGQADNFKDLFEQLLIYSRQQHFTLIIDEFQDFERINKSIFSDIQDVWDRHKDKAQLNFVVSGSVYSLLVRIFENEKEPLFGRLDAKMVLRPFTTGTIKEVLGDYSPKYQPEDLLCLYMLSGGVPKYLNLLMSAGAYDKASMLAYTCGTGSPFLSEGKELLVSEFGKDYSTYFSILQLIASGKTSQQEIDSVLGKVSSAYLHNLNEEYSLVSKNRPLFSKLGSRNVRWQISDCYLRFWFNFVYAHQFVVESGRNDLLLELVEEGYTNFSGRTLEDYFRAKFSEEGRFTKVGSYWDRSGENEIDLVAISDLEKNALIAEIKRDKSRISLRRLQKKSLTLKNELSKYDLKYQALSLEDM